MMPIDRHPSRRDLRVFQLFVLLAFGLAGSIQWRLGSPRVAQALWIVGGATSVAMVVAPSARRWTYVAWMTASYPVGWLVSHALLAAVHVLVATPTALVLRLLRRDPMQRGFDANATTYWTARRPQTDRGRYFRQS